MKLPLRVQATTHEGLVHDKNEDSHAVVTTDEGGMLLLVCDGMGGMGHGEVASAMAVEHITRMVREGHGFPPERLRRAVREADTIVRNELCADGRGMPGATAVMAYVLDGMAHVAWAGDSRAYLVRDGTMVERTRDHKLVNELIAAGQLTEEEAKHSALAHVVTRALGGRPPTERPVKASSLGHPWKLSNGDTVVLCSDGVCDLVNDDEVAQMVTGVPPDLGARALLQASLDRGGHDNITCIVARWEGEDYLEDEKATPSFTMRDHSPERDLRDPVPLASGLDDEVTADWGPDGLERGAVTEEIDPNWRPGDEEDTGITQQGLLDDPVSEEEPNTLDGTLLPVAKPPEGDEDAVDAPPALADGEEADKKTRTPPETPRVEAPAAPAGPSPMIAVAGAIGLLVVFGLLLGLCR